MLQSQFFDCRAAALLIVIGIFPPWIYAQNTQPLSLASEAATVLIERAKVEKASAWL